MRKMDKKNKVFETSYPVFYKEVMTICVGVCLAMIALLEIVYGIMENKAVFVFLLILCLLILLLKIGIGRYNITVEEMNVVVIPLAGRKITILLSEIDELRESKSGNLTIVCENKKVVSIDQAVEDYEQLCKVLEKKLGKRIIEK